MNYHKIIILKGRVHYPYMGDKEVFNVNNQECERAEINTQALRVS